MIYSGVFLLLLFLSSEFCAKIIEKKKERRCWVSHRSALHRHQSIPLRWVLMKESSGGDLSAGPQVVTCGNQVPPSVSVTGLETESASERERKKKDAHHPPRTPRCPPPGSPHCWPRTRTPSTRVLSSVMSRCFASSLWLLLRGHGSRLLDAPPTLCHNAGAPEEQTPILSSWS